MPVNVTETRVQQQQQGCERPIQQTGWGLYHYFMIGIASACTFSQATASTSVPFAVPLAICDFALARSAISTVNICFSTGMAIGGFFLTSTSDTLGRKSMVSFTLLLMFGSTFAGGFAHGSFMLIACVFLLGCGLAANANCVKIHLAEVLPAEKRGFYLVFPDLFWTMGYIVSATVAWLLTPSILRNQKKDMMRLATWRLMFGLSGCFSVMVACATALLQPSPRFLLFAKKYPEALDTLKHIYAINNSKHCESYSVRQEDLEGCVDDFSLLNEPEPVTCIEHTLFVLRRIWKLTCQLVKRRFALVTVLLIFTKFSVVTGIFSINVWLAKMLQYDNEDGCYINETDILHMEDNFDGCNFSESSVLYRDFFLLALNIFFGQLIALALIDRLGRRISVVCGCIACGASSFALGYEHRIYPARLVTSSVFMMAYSLVDSVLNVITIEAYPTAFRGTAAGGTQFFATFIGGFVKKYLQTPCQYSFIFVGALMLAAAMLCYFLPELRGQAMVE